ncbi:isoaspartyl peptidase/L-asparaginase-like [Xenia sp. Carnegie-2017]|uniref:isoaspartyl peptidase/L-asparaginase-like n=1 Tax=Xenia sp. Carnegie-2017 TaxID=2897299 RepID=UPI001F042288|nr:isoaspartyl peptidase/L-asparaginase-like [Xenia sp. Carnegie-2017]
MNANLENSSADEALNTILPRIVVQVSPSYYFVFAGHIEKITQALNEACRMGYDVLCNGGTAVDAVEKTICSIEDNFFFNCGYGSFLNNDGDIECDAMIMDGNTLDTGAVMAARNFKNPVAIARQIMEKTIHSAIAGDGVLDFAKKIEFETCTNDQLKHPQAEEYRINYDQLPKIIEKHFGVCDSVSAVAMDKDGHFACALSSGGLPGKLKGRLSEACTVGCGGYANKYGAAATGGYGEAIRKMTLARQVVFNMESGQDAQASVRNALQLMKETLPRKDFPLASAISIDCNGKIGVESETSILWSSIAGGEKWCGMKMKPKKE